MPLIGIDLSARRTDHKVVLVVREEGHARRVGLHERVGGAGCGLTDSALLPRLAHHLEAPGADRPVGTHADHIVCVLRSDHLNRVHRLRVRGRRVGASLHWRPFR